MRLLSLKHLQDTVSSEYYHPEIPLSINTFCSFPRAFFRQPLSGFPSFLGDASLEGGFPLLWRSGSGILTPSPLPLFQPFIKETIMNTS